MLYRAPAAYGPPQYPTPQLRDHGSLACMGACRERDPAAAYAGTPCLRSYYETLLARDAFYAELKARCGR